MKKPRYAPTLSEMGELMGKSLYIEFIWMWRENQQNALAAERRALLAIPARKVDEWPAPAFAPAPKRDVPLPDREFLIKRLRAVWSSDAPAPGEAEISSALLTLQAEKQPRQGAIADQRDLAS